MESRCHRRNSGTQGGSKVTSATATLARSITWAGSRQSYLTARLLADRHLVDDCLRAYAYFRWADDQIDITLPSCTERTAFITRQKSLFERLCRGERPSNLQPEEAMLADLMAHNRTSDSGLCSFIHNFMEVIAFDACRQGKLPSQEELAAYTTRLATAVMDGIQYFIGNDHSYPRTHNRTLAVRGAHITHMLRDMLDDISAGVVNIPVEYFKAHGLDIKQVNSEEFRRWVRGQVELARSCFQEGKKYIDSLEVLRCKLAGTWYCARFECVLDAIQRDGYQLRSEYPECHALKVWLEMARLSMVVTCNHLGRRIRRLFIQRNHPIELDTKLETPPQARKT
jgi:phytoene/squalene synthetase